MNAAWKVFLSGVGIVVGAQLCGQVVGCAETLKSVDDINDPSDDAKLSKCRGDARAEMHIYGDPDRAWNVYLACKADAGLP